MCHRSHAYILGENGKLINFLWIIWAAPLAGLYELHQKQELLYKRVKSFGCSILLSKLTHQISVQVWPVLGLKSENQLTL